MEFTLEPQQHKSLYDCMTLPFEADNIGPTEGKYISREWNISSHCQTELQ